jgi:superfamily II DNA or RNA helicase
MTSSLRFYQRPHVDKLISILVDRRVAHDGSDAGTGKTYCAAEIASVFNVETLVICPLSVVPAWRSVLESFGVSATVMNYESAWRKLGVKVKCGRGFFFVFSKAYPLVIYDEVHRTGGETTINSKMLIASKRNGSRILTLSATAADSVMRLKALGFTLGLHSLQNYRDWLMAYGAAEKPIYGRGGKPVLQKDGRPAPKMELGKRANTEAMQRLHEQIFGSGNRGSRMRIVDIPDFPATQIEVRLLDGMSKELERLSDELQQFYTQRNVLAQFTEDELAKLVFWRQAAETAKIPHLLDMAEDALETSRVAIFANFNRTVDELLSEAKKRDWKTAFIRGDQSPIERQVAIAAFQQNCIDLIVCNVQAGGVGVSLHDAATKVPRTSLICPPWSAVDLKQCFGRVHRDGGGTSRQFLVYWSTGIEARVASAVKRKLTDLSLLNDDELDASFDRRSEPKATFL